MKRIAFFDTKQYDKESFDRLNNGRYELCYFEYSLKFEYRIFVNFFYTLSLFFPFLKARLE